MLSVPFSEDLAHKLESRLSLKCGRGEKNQRDLQGSDTVIQVYKSNEGGGRYLTLGAENYLCSSSSPILTQRNTYVIPSRSVSPRK